MALPSTNTIFALFLVIDDSGQMAKIKKDLVMTKCKNVVMVDYSSKVPGGNFYSSICFQVYRRQNKVIITSWHGSDIVSELPYTFEEADEKWDEALGNGYQVAF